MPDQEQRDLAMKRILKVGFCFSPVPLSPPFTSITSIQAIHFESRKTAKFEGNKAIPRIAFLDRAVWYGSLLGKNMLGLYDACGGMGCQGLS